MKKRANELKKDFLKKVVQMAKEHMKKCPSCDHKGNANQNHIKILPQRGF
jgi:hypothetical protein